MEKFWGKVALMEVRDQSNRYFARDALEFPTERVPLVCSRGRGREWGPDRVVGYVEHIWYGDESGMQVIYFDGEVVAYEDVNPYPALFVTNALVVVEDEGLRFNKGVVQQIDLVDTPNWPGVFVRSGELPEMLQEERDRRF